MQNKKEKEFSTVAEAKLEASTASAAGNSNTRLVTDVVCTNKYTDSLADTSEPFIF